MIILALDLGTKTGWKIGDRAINLSGVWDFSNSRFDGGGMRFVRFLKSLNELAAATTPELVTYEEVRRHMGVDAAHVYGGFQAHLTAWCEQRNLPYKAVPVQTIKKFATGKGNANKEAMIAAMCAIGLDPVDDNHADAMALWAYAQKEFGGS
jgi:crossover junction endodeoxyribonuclease RuvC